PHRFGNSAPTSSEIARVICDEEPLRASAVAIEPEMRRQLRGDLDTILFRALAKAPERRYRGASHLADDLRRYLEHRPVRARPDTFGYRAGKFFRRNKAAVAAGSVIFALLIGGIASTLWQARRAERRFNDVRKIANSLLFELHDSIAEVPGALAARQLVTRRALDYLDSLAEEAGNDRSLKSELAAAYEKIGRITFDTQQAINSHRKAALLNEALVRASPNDTTARKQLSESYSNLSNVMKVSGDSRQAIEFGRKSLAVAQALAADLPTDEAVQADLVSRYETVSNALLDAGDAPAALESALVALRKQQELADAEPSAKEPLHNLAVTYGLASYAFEEVGDYAAARAHGERQMEIMQRLFASDPANTVYRRALWTGYLRHGRQSAATGEAAPAFESYGRATELMEALSAADPNDAGHRRWLAVTYSLAGDLFAATGQPDRALERYGKAIPISEALVAADPSRVEARRDLANFYRAVGVILTKKGALDSAFDVLKKAESLAHASTQQDPENTRVRSRYAEVLFAIAQTHRAAAVQGSHDAHLQSARSYLERSLAEWQHVQKSGRLSHLDATKPEAVARELDALPRS
ncbi:MAG TPA: hypothetical protein VF683_06325, partial [Chthoniobacterales bacterium]